MNLKRIIREELDGLEWIKDTKSNQDIAQEIADETKIKNGKLYPPFLSSHTSLSSPLFILSPSPLFRNYGEEQYGLNKEDANDVWKRYGKLLKNKVNNLNESNELEWIKDTNSNQDIAQEIADETKIKNDLLHPPFTLSHPFKSHVSIPLHSLPLFLSHFSSFPLLSSSFTKYGKEQYGLNKEDANDVWERYKKLIENKVNNLNESNDLQWIQGGPDFNLQTSEFYIDLDGVSSEEACEIQQKILDMGVYWSGKGKNLKKEHCKSKAYTIKKGKLYISTYNYNEYNTMIKQLKDTTENFPRLYGKNFSQLFK